MIQTGYRILMIQIFQLINKILAVEVGGVVVEEVEEVLAFKDPWVKILNTVKVAARTRFKLRSKWQISISSLITWRALLSRIISNMPWN